MTKAKWFATALLTGSLAAPAFAQIGIYIGQTPPPLRWSHPHYDHYDHGWQMHEGHWDREDHGDHHDFGHDRGHDRDRH